MSGFACGLLLQIPLLSPQWIVMPTKSVTAFAVETFPTSQPARAHGTHGAGVFFGEPESPVTMLKLVSADGVGGVVAGLPPSVVSVQYLNEDEKPTDPFGLK